MSMLSMPISADLIISVLAAYLAMLSMLLSVSYVFIIPLL